MFGADAQKLLLSWCVTMCENRLYSNILSVLLSEIVIFIYSYIL